MSLVGQARQFCGELREYLFSLGIYELNKKFSRFYSNFHFMGIAASLASLISRADSPKILGNFSI